MVDSGTLDLIKRGIDEQSRWASYGQIAAALLGLYWVLSIFNGKSSPRLPGAQVHGHKWRWEPALVLQIRFVFVQKYPMGRPSIRHGYHSPPNQVPRRDAIDSKKKLNGKFPQVNNLVPRWTWTQFMMDSDLIVRVLNSKLTPDLTKFVELARTELEYAWEIDVPKPDSKRNIHVLITPANTLNTLDWKEVDIQEVMRMLVARMSAKVFMGQPACRNMDWLRVSIEFTYDMFAAAFTLRMFPPWLHPIVAHFVAARWRMRRNINIGKAVIGDLMRERRDALERGEEPDDTLLGWMTDNGTEKEVEISEMAARQCALTLASIHTTSLGVSNVLFDLASHPEWVPVLREEIEEVTKAYGKMGEKGMPSKQWIAKLEKMDSFLVESQRINPPILLRPQRLALTPLTLKDGTHIPKGAMVAWAGHHHANDPSIAPEPEVFDPMRNYRKRHANNGENMNKFVAGQTDINSLSFGYGGQACPGRYFAVSEIKMILARLLVELDFAYPEGKSRPQNMFADENVFMDPKAKLMMRKRL
ncbi:hypothetical protein ASPVEDRAFT_32144 [Aspergillus versicolor CBS 583.65]|uniref:Cytochrome P450 n=1 Tax=Aspergillus versicolor CBS 583.65 TaxID=1036611 RepID=A0A1L9PW83_ASPVE|nr:uncharacterized protein ASPVEDRAFT_32144 [Aspergillus versicolor CBS 583.65]OJJ05788.1 hypothetical protein ASPVEDRAFT_32144 [Aspergillus versicolor CBS 583.65]